MGMQYALVASNIYHCSYIGEYRVQVNRGGGILHAFLAKNCVKAPLSGKKGGASEDAEQFLRKHSTAKEVVQLSEDGSGGSASGVIVPDDSKEDYEVQNIKLLTKQQLLHIILNTKEIGEAQWLAAISTGLLYEEYHTIT